MNEPSPVAAPAQPPWWLRFLFSLAATGLALVLSFLLALIMLGCVAPRLDLFTSDSVSPVKAAFILLLLFFIFLPLGVLAVATRKRRVPWKVVAAGWIGVLPVLVWLAWDEPSIRQPLSLEEFSPAFAGAEQSYAVLMQYSKQIPGPEAQAFAAVKPAVYFNSNPREPEKWLAFVVKNRAGLEADWALYAPQRRWLEELNSFDRIGDLSRADPDTNIITFQVWRTLSQRGCAQATLQALDGHGDEAVATLVPLIETGRKLQLSSRYLVRSMIGVVVERMAVETAAIVLDHATVSPAAQARLLAALGPELASALARRLILVEYAQFYPVFSKMALGDAVALLSWRGPRFLLRRPLNFISGLLLNPNATVNLYSRGVFALADLAAAKELGQFNVLSKQMQQGLVHEPGMKNLAGRLVLVMAVPSYDKIIESHWKLSELRTSLRRRLGDASAEPATAPTVPAAAGS